MIFLAAAVKCDLFIEVGQGRRRLNQRLFPSSSRASRRTRSSSLPTPRACPPAPLWNARRRSLNKRFLFTLLHQNPVPFTMKLLEVSRAKTARTRHLEKIAEFRSGHPRQGQIVFRKDTPNFVANRLGGCRHYAPQEAALDCGFSPSREVDANSSGAPLGRPQEPRGIPPPPTTLRRASTPSCTTSPNDCSTRPAKYDRRETSRSRLQIVGHGPRRIPPRRQDAVASLRRPKREVVTRRSQHPSSTARKSRMASFSSIVVVPRVRPTAKEASARCSSQGRTIPPISVASA